MQHFQVVYHEKSQSHFRVSQYTHMLLGEYVNQENSLKFQGIPQDNVE